MMRFTHSKPHVPANKRHGWFSGGPIATNVVLVILSFVICVGIFLFAIPGDVNDHSSLAEVLSNTRIIDTRALSDKVAELIPAGVEHDHSAPFSSHHHSKTYFNPNCPEYPEPGYPKTFKMLDILNNWNADVTDIPAFHYDSLCHFDYRNATQLKYSYNYRSKEVPFVMRNIPELDEVVHRWSSVDYISKMLGGKSFRTETSNDNHFMYWNGGSRSFLRSKSGEGWKPPTTAIRETFDDWLKLAVRGQNTSLANRVHHYFRVSSDAANRWLFDELPFFKPKKSLFMVEPNEQRGIHCRFGMRSVIAEAHFDGSRNAVVMLGGMRRWILTHPDQCSNMHMYGPTHPSGRHSAVDWSKPDIEKFPNFPKVMGNEVILTPGDYLFVPTVWIHYIVSLNVNYQCNTRSGIYPGYQKHLKECGF